MRLRQLRFENLARVLSIALIAGMLFMSCDRQTKEPCSHVGSAGNSLTNPVPSRFEGMISNPDIRVEATVDGWNISLKNNLWASELDVWFDGDFQGTINKAYDSPDRNMWRTFYTPCRVKRVVVGVTTSQYDKDIGRAWYRDLN